VLLGCSTVALFWIGADLGTSYTGFVQYFLYFWLRLCSSAHTSIQASQTSCYHCNPALFWYKKL